MVKLKCQLNLVSAQLASSIPQRRQASSSSLFTPINSFFSRQSPPSQPQEPIPDEPPTALDGLLAALAEADLQEAQRQYEAIVSAPSPQDSLSAVDLEILLQALDSLPSTSTSPDLAVLDFQRKVYSDLTATFGYSPSIQHRQQLIQSLLRAGLPEEASVVANQTTAGYWKAILRSALEHTPDAFEAIFDRCRASGRLCSPDFAVLFRHLRLNDSLSPEEKLAKMTQAREEMKAANMRLDYEGQAELLLLRIQLGELALAKEQYDGWVMFETWSESMREAAMELETALGGLDGLDSATDTVTDGPQDSAAQIGDRLRDALARREVKNGPSLLDFLHRVDSLNMDKPATSIMREVIKPIQQRPELVIALYDHLRSLNVDLEPALVVPIIRALCFVQSPRLPDLKRIYDDFIGSPMFTTATDRQLLTMYQSLLAACGRTPPSLAGPVDPHAFALSLLTDMRPRRLPLSYTARTSLTLILMRAASDHLGAFQIYAHFYALDSSALDAAAYLEILSVFRGLSWDRSPFAPPNLYLEIVKDMRLAGYRPGSAALASLLSSYGLAARQSRKTSNDPLYREQKLLSLLKGIRDIHTLIRLDPVVEVDLPLLNALMDAYARVGAYAEAFEVWDEIVLRRPRETQADPEHITETYQPSINIALDACGYAEAPRRARKIWRWAEKHDLVTPKVRETWIECLCRLGFLQEALGEVVALGEKGDATRGMVEIVLKFSWRDPINWRRVQGQIRRAFPEWWDDVRGIVETRSSIHRRA